MPAPSTPTPPTAPPGALPAPPPIVRLEGTVEPPSGQYDAAEHNPGRPERREPDPVDLDDEQEGEL